MPESAADCDSAAGQCVESGKRLWVACEQVTCLAHGTAGLGSGEQDIRIQEYLHLTPPLALGIELGRQHRL